MIIFDILVAAVFLGFTFIGYKRGFFLSIMRIVVVVAALLIAIWASKPLSEWTYDTFIDASIKDSISMELCQKNSIKQLKAFLKSFKTRW